MPDHVFTAPDWLQREDELLAPYAMHTRDSKGRKHPEAAHAFRTLYQRDRDRIVHSTAFRRLMYKTQVLVNQAGDYHRTRLTHTLEVAQISRTIARQLGLNEDLTEAIALMHDLGHPPFGHAGEAALNECMRDHGGYEHNLHALRIVEKLEYRYPNFSGLNLSWEVLEAQAMHSKKKDAPEIQAFLAAGQPFLEAQIVDAADSLAYDCHDVDDALAMNLITMYDLEQVPFWRQARERVTKAHQNILPEQLQPAVIRSLIDWQVTDLLEQVRKNLTHAKIHTLEDLRNSTTLLAEPGEEVRGLKADLERFLTTKVYRHHRVMRMAHKGQRIIRMLFDAFRENPIQLPERYYRLAQTESLERTVCDYLAGMTDRYAQDEYLRLFQPYFPV